MINSYDLIRDHPETFNTLRVKDMLFAYYICPQVDKMEKSWTHFNSISFPMDGKKTFHQGSQSWTAQDNTTVFIRKTAYTEEMYEFEGWKLVSFYFPDDFLRLVFDEYRPFLPLKDLPPCPKDMLIYIHISETSRAFFYSFIPYFYQRITPPENLLIMKFKELLFDIFSDPSNVNLLAYISSLSDQYKTPLWEIMEANYMFNLSIGEFARMSNRSIASFKREFQEYYDTTPGRWLTYKRLEHAKLILETTRRNITDIALESGFENLSHFSRIFKEKHGASPIQYRKEQKQPAEPYPIY